MILDAQNLSYAYQDIPLFESITLQIQKPGLYLIKGPNGAGKTTLLKMLSGILKPSTGSVQTKITSLYIGHLNALHDQLTLSEMLDYYTHFLRSTQSDRSHRALNSFSLQDWLDTKMSDLSYGQKRKASLMRLFLRDSPLWILDEPFQGLDQEAHTFLWSEIDSFIQSNGTCVMTSHESPSAIQLPFKVFDLTFGEKS
ncbi:MAG: heme ABC exporter ATP-binding protein CcmA [Alphaproteobacteria bacterium]|jgi:heme ABC exporter ATP-binding subunit CcmA|nr:heme ABC exporter ATP-binding protein CcmA [Alphaproteobacteria bacterium]MBP9877205.1 heme ABC exporter ATP-binding protein CcmA [Alphaproteobacteria bacterium]